MKKVLYIVATATFGEAEQKLYHLISRLREQNRVDIKVGFLHNNPLKLKLQNLDVECYILGGLPGLARFIQSNYIDVAHFYSSKRVLQTLVQNCLSHTKIVETVFNQGVRGDSTQAVDRRKIHASIFDNESLQHQWGSCPSSVILHGVNPNVLKKENRNILRSRYNVGRDKTKIIGIVEKENEKLDINLIVRLASKFRDRRQPFKIVVFCKETIKRIIANKVRSQNLEYFLCADSSDISLSFLDIYLDLSSGSELRMSCLEAVCYKIPIILRDSDVNRQFLEKQKSGFLYKGNDPVDVVEKYCIMSAKVNRKEIALSSLLHIDKTIEQIIKNYELSPTPKVEKMQISEKMYCIVPYAIYGGAEVYLENHILKGTFPNIHLLFLSNNPLYTKMKDVVPCTIISGLTELGNFLLAQNIRNVCFYNSANVYRLLARVKKINGASITEIIHSFHKWADSMHAIKRSVVDRTYVVAETIARQWEISKFELLPPTINESRFQVPKTRHKDIVIGTVARLSPEKNLKRIVDIAAYMGKGYRFVIVGKDGGSGQELAQYIKRKGLVSKVMIRPHTDKIEYEYAGFDVFLLTSHVEGTPITILEAQAAGLPVVAPDVGAIKEMLVGKSGYAYHPNIDDKLLASKIMGLARTKHLRPHPPISRRTDKMLTTQAASYKGTGDLSTVVFCNARLTNRPLRQGYALQQQGIKSVAITGSARHWSATNTAEMDRHFSAIIDTHSEIPRMKEHIMPIMEHKPDLFIVTSPPPEAFFYLKAVYPNVPIVVDYEDTPALELERERFVVQHLKQKEIDMLQAADGIVFVGEHHKKMIGNYYNIALEEKSFCVPNYSLQKFLPKKRLPKLSAQDGETHIVYVGGYVSSPRTRNNCYNLKQVIQQLVAQKIHVHLYLNDTRTGLSHPYLHEEKHLPFDELLIQLTQYDYGCCLYNEADLGNRVLQVLNPNKFYDYLNAGLPVLVTPLAYQLAEIVATTKHGIVTNAADAKTNIELNKNEVKIPTDFFVLDNIADTYVDFLSSIVKKSR